MSKILQLPNAFNRRLIKWIQIKFTQKLFQETNPKDIFFKSFMFIAPLELESYSMDIEFCSNFI